MKKMKTSNSERDSYRAAARVWLDLSETVAQDRPYACSFLGASCYSMGVPVTVYNISKLHFVGSYRTAKRYCDLMVSAGALEYTESGAVVITEKGKQTSDWYFKALFEMQKQVAKVLPK